MNQLKILNCSRIQEILLRHEFSKSGYPQGKITIYFDQEIVGGRCHCLWYGGGVTSIDYKGYTFSISASGDVIASLQSKTDFHEIARVKDKSNGGIFMDEMGGYIEDDNRLSMAIQNRDPEYLLDIENNNWLELDMMNSHGKWSHLDIILNSEFIFDAVVETIGMMEEIIKNTEEKRIGKTV